jgi:hypothetical protein
MATGAVVNQGKRAFVEKYFVSNPGGNLESVNKAWTAAGNEGTVSESLVGKVRSNLGLTGKKATEVSRPIEVSAKAKTPPKPKKVSKTVKHAPPTTNGSVAPAAVIAATGHDEDVLDELEEGIDELIHRLRELGGKPDVVKALRRARRLLVRSHEG